MKTLGAESKAFALVSFYSPPDDYLLHISSNTLVVCRYQGEEALVVIDVRSILSVVAMVPFPFVVGGRDDQFFVIEKIGLDVIEVDSLNDNE